MRALNHRGFTLVELLVAIVLMGIVATGIYRVLVGNQRMYHAQVQRIDLQQNIRAAATILPAEFREMDASDGDIYRMAPTWIEIRAPRQVGFLCAAPVLPAGGTAVFMVRKDLFFGPREFDEVKDSLLLYYEGDESTRSDDGWVLADPVAIVNAVCPTLDKRPAWEITAALRFVGAQVNSGGTRRIPNGGPVRGFVPVRYELYQSSGRWYIGYDELTDGSGVQPIIGPVTSNGITFEYYDSAGVVTADPLAVQQIGVVLRAETAAPVHGTNRGLFIPVDSMATRVALRNNRRW